MISSCLVQIALYTLVSKSGLKVADSTVFLRVLLSHLLNAIFIFRSSKEKGFCK